MFSSLRIGGGGVDQRGGKVGERPEEVGRTGRLHPFLDVAEHDGADGDGDEVLNQRLPLADVAGQGEAGLHGADRVVEAALAQLQPVARRRRAATVRMC